MNEECEGSGNSALAGLDMVKCAQDAQGFGWAWLALSVAVVGVLVVAYSARNKASGR